MEKKANGFPMGHVYGLVLSLLLTFLAAGVVLKTALSFPAVMAIIGTLAILQAALQLFMFMHVTEGEDGKTNLINIVYGVVCAVIIVAGSVWVLTSGHAH
ncbi:cytochrome aa3 quinol oxidase subunit IV [Effusibacillus consociatus]|uniref:Quinol oxidase subunit 4 n=1 Tax=Effusibacillus consociatus TaxID=1117041 RepID=A0ABV9Q0H5_9BACL